MLAAGSAFVRALPQSFEKGTKFVAGLSVDSKYQI